MESLNKLSCVAERDIDLLLIEEFNVNPKFAAWFLQLISPDLKEPPLCSGAWHSVSHARLGESDLVVAYENGMAVLIENKVDAPAQPDQAARYQLRGNKGCEEELWQSFVAVIVAPARYLDANSEADRYDRKISYEQMRDWLKGQTDCRSKYRAFVLDEAIEQNRRGYSPVKDQGVTQFFLAYWSLATDQCPVLKMPNPGIKPAGSGWARFQPDDIGKKCVIKHKMDKGCVDLEIQCQAEQLSQISAIAEDPTLEIAPTEVPHSQWAREVYRDCS